MAHKQSTRVVHKHKLGMKHTNRKSNNTFNTFLQKQCLLDLDSPAMEDSMPETWLWKWLKKDISDWIIPRPNSVHLLKKGMDVRSCYLRYSKSTEGQLQTWAEHLSGHWLSHKPSEVSVALDLPYKRPAAPWLKNDAVPYWELPGQG